METAVNYTYASPAAEASAMKLRAPQSQRDAEAAAVNCKWLEPCINGVTPSLIQCLDPECGYIWGCRPSDVRKKIRRGLETGCPSCNGFVITDEQRDAEAAAVNCTWTEPYTNSYTPRGCRCNDESCGHEWKVTPNDVQKKGGCPKCNTGVFNYDAPARNYLVQDGTAAKVGVTSNAAKVDRFKILGRYGWVPVKTWDVESGRLALKVERATLKWMREELELNPAYTEGIGCSETVLLSELSLERIINKIEQLINEYEQENEVREPIQEV